MLYGKQWLENQGAGKSGAAESKKETQKKKNKSAKKDKEGYRGGRAEGVKTKKKLEAQTRYMLTGDGAKIPTMWNPTR